MLVCIMSYSYVVCLHVMKISTCCLLQRFGGIPVLVVTQGIDFILVLFLDHYYTIL